MNPHVSKASIGIGGNSTTTGGLIKTDASETMNLASVILPKYTTRILFLNVIAYILSQPGQPVRRHRKKNTTCLNMTKISEESMNSGPTTTLM